MSLKPNESKVKVVPVTYLELSQKKVLREKDKKKLWMWWSNEKVVIWQQYVITKDKLCLNSIYLTLRHVFQEQNCLETSREQPHSSILRGFPFINIYMSNSNSILSFPEVNPSKLISLLTFFDVKLRHFMVNLSIMYMTKVQA